MVQQKRVYIGKVLRKLTLITVGFSLQELAKGEHMKDEYKRTPVHRNSIQNLNVPKFGEE